MEDSNITEKVKNISSKISFLKANKPLIIAIVTILSSLILFLLLIIAPLLALGVITPEDLKEIGLSYSDIDSTNSFLWPIGSDETEAKNGVLFATGTPHANTITSYFGYRKDPFGSGETYGHSGLDISPTDGPGYGVVNVIAAKDGTVTYPYAGAGTNCSSGAGDLSCGGGYGNFVMITHSDGTQTVYAHMYQGTITVKAGDTVKAGQVIGKMGSSGQSTGLHLHFEVRVNGERTDPLNYVSMDNPRPKSTSSKYIVEGSDNEQTVCMSLKSAGYSDVAVAAMLGNFAKESSYDPNVVNSIGCTGLAQWCYGRKNNLINTYGDKWNVLENQINFVFYELDNTDESAAKRYLNDSSIGVRDMAFKFCDGFERPGTSVCYQTDPNHDRMGYAESVYPYVKNGCKKG